MSPALAIGALSALAIALLGYVALRRYSLAFLRTEGRRSARTPTILGLDGTPFEYDALGHGERDPSYTSVVAGFVEWALGRAVTNVV